IAVPRFGGHVLEPLRAPAPVNQSDTLLKSDVALSCGVFRRGKELNQVRPGDDHAADLVRMFDGKLNRRCRGRMAFRDDYRFDHLLFAYKSENISLKATGPSQFTEARACGGHRASRRPVNSRRG